MYVRSLRLAGFKSFADATVLDFEPGVNVIVGPNGSGKSNIADALAWVLGVQAPTALRGASMEDVIFAGSQSRQRHGIAEVALTLDNVSRALPLDLNEVTISRSIDRSGASEYRINGAACRLIDIAELLSDTGVGRSIHTVVGQGNLDEVLEARPEDRRAFIEEAAQVGKHRRRKDRALRKIERVDDNLTRLNDVLEELRRSLRPLKRQASVAAAYSELVGEHRELRQRLAATDLARLEQDVAAADADVLAKRAGLLSDELASIRAQLGSAGSEKERLALAAEETQSLAYGIRRAAERLSGLERLARQRGELISARLRAETEQGYRERIRLLDAARDRWIRESESLEEAAASASSAARRAVEEAVEVERTLASAEETLAAARSAETTAAQSLVRAEGAEAAGRATLGALTSRVKAVEERREVTQREVAADAAAVESASREVATLEAELDSAAELAASAESVLEGVRERAEGLKEGLGASHADSAAASARESALTEALEAVADLPEAVARIGPLRDRAATVAQTAALSEDEARARTAEAEAEVEKRWHEVARCDQELKRLDALVAGAAERLAGRRRRHETREIELAALDDEISRAQMTLADAERSAIGERAELPVHRETLDRAREQREQCESQVMLLRTSVTSARQAATSVELDARTAEERALAAKLQLEEAEAGGADARAALEGLAGRRATLEGARERAEQVAAAAAKASSAASQWATAAEERAGQARVDAKTADQKLTSLYSRETELARSLEDAGRRRTEAEVRRAEVTARAESIGERAMEEWGLGREDLALLQSFQEQEEIASRARAEKLERDMRRMGAVNPHAADEYAELAEREKFLVEQMEDLRGSRRDLMKIVREVDDTIVEVFAIAFEDVAREFENVVGRLFPGGSGRLKLTQPDDLLNTGVEIEARPPGKNVRKLSLLSGGERSLVALAFLFSIFRSRPSPFYLLDEVEAALDDINLNRFLGLIAELEERAQVLIVTHQKRTMEAADILYGVSMARDGVSTVIAKKMGRRAGTVAARG